MSLNPIQIVHLSLRNPEVVLDEYKHIYKHIYATISII